MANAITTNKAAITRLEGARARTDKPWQQAVLNVRIFALIGDIRGRRSGDIEEGRETRVSRMAREVLAAPRLGRVA